MAGFGHKTGIDLPNETGKHHAFDEMEIAHFAAEMVCAAKPFQVAIGQGAVTVSPLQLAAAIGGWGTEASGTAAFDESGFAQTVA